MPLDWQDGGDDRSAAVAPDPDGGYSVYVARDDGILMFLGPRWRSCPRPAKPCPRPSRVHTPRWHGDSEKCRRCAYSGEAHPATDRAGAMRIAELIQQHLADAD